MDGTNGDTWLEPVEATLGGSHFWTQGQIVRVAPEPTEGGTNRRARYCADSERGPGADGGFSAAGEPRRDSAADGCAEMKARLEIPPGPVPVDERLRLNGTFALDDAQFTSAKIQDRIVELSARGQGQPKDAKNGGEADVRRR